MIEIDSRGFIKGTETKYQLKVVVKKRFSTSGKIVLPGDVIELTGDALITSLKLGKVRKYDPAVDEKQDKPENKKQSKKKSKK